MKPKAHFAAPRFAITGLRARIPSRNTNFFTPSVSFEIFPCNRLFGQRIPGLNRVTNAIASVLRAR